MLIHVIALGRNTMWLKGQVSPDGRWRMNALGYLYHVYEIRAL